MAPPIAAAKVTLSYPLYAAGFDPKNSDFLVVGGGGGEGRSGVGNKITLIDTSRKHEISEVVDVELSRDEDSVTTLAVAQSSATSAVVFAGINSSTAQQQAGKNEHLRSFKLDYPPVKSSGSGNKATTTPQKIGTQALGKATLFKSTKESKKETYQRVLRLSPVGKDTVDRIGVIATGLAPEGEVVIFDASKSNPTGSDVRKRIQLGKGVEAADVDVIKAEDGGHLVTYCTDYEVYLCSVSSTQNGMIPDPVFVHGIPHQDVSSSAKKRPTFRSLRFLTPTLIVLLQNQPEKTGAELLLLDITDREALGTIILRKRLHKTIKSSTALTTTTLPTSKPSEKIQHVLAVAGQDISLEILTLEQPSIRKATTSLKFRLHTILHNVHPLQMTALAFSTFTPPLDPAKAPSQYLKLASASMSSTVVVHTFRLTRYPTSDQINARSYVLQPSSGGVENGMLGFSIFVSVVLIAIGAVLLQIFTEIRGVTPEYLGAKNWLGPRLQRAIARPYMFEDIKADVADLPHVEEMMPDISNMGDKVLGEVRSIKSSIPSVEELKHDAEAVKGKLSLRALLSHRRVSKDAAEAVPLLAVSDKSIVVRDEGHSISTELHHDESAVVKEGKRWEELSQAQRKGWKKRLVAAGEWVEDETETVLKGVFFGELAGTVGQAVAGVVG